MPGLAAALLAANVKPANGRRKTQFVIANSATSLFVVCHLLTVSPGRVVAWLTDLGRGIAGGGAGRTLGAAVRAGTVFQRTMHVCAAFVSSPFLSGSTSLSLQQVICSTVRLPMTKTASLLSKRGCGLQRFNASQHASTRSPEHNRYAGSCPEACVLLQPWATEELCKILRRGDGVAINIGCW